MAGTTRRFTDEQIERANRVDIVDYARSQGLTLKRTGNTYRVMDYSGGFYITPEKNLWNLFNGQTGGGVIQLCQFLENKTWAEAVKTLLNEDMEPIRRQADWKPEEQPAKEFNLPEKNDTYKHVIAYLTKTRGIDYGIVKKMIGQGIIYENMQRSCVFVGLDQEGVPRHASVRSTNTVGKVFKQDVTGSRKEFSFSISGSSEVLNITEAPIDLLSYMSLQKHHGIALNDSYVSLGGVSDKALEHFLSGHDNITKIRVCTDNDPAGDRAAQIIFEKYHEQYKITRHRPKHKDFNEDLVALKYPERDNEKKNENQQSVDAEPKKNETKISETDYLKELGAGDQLITWYENLPDKHNLLSSNFYIEGKCEVLYVCDDVKELISMMENHMQLKEGIFGEQIPEDLMPDEYYVTYKGAKALQEFAASHPDIKTILTATSRTEAGEKAADEIKKIFGGRYECKRMEPRLLKYSDDLAQTNAIEKVLEQTPLESLQQMDMAVGMEV